MATDSKDKAADREAKAADKYLDKAMSPNQPPPIRHDVEAGRKAEQERAEAVDEAVRLAQDKLPEGGGNTWEPEK